MDVASIAGGSSDLSAVQTATAIGVRVLRKALDIQEQAAQQLLQTLPAVNNPPNLGQSIDVKA